MTLSNFYHATNHYHLVRLYNVCLYGCLRVTFVNIFNVYLCLSTIRNYVFTSVCLRLTFVNLFDFI